MTEEVFYYKDSNYELELNLQQLRRSLIQMMDEFEQQDCTRCYKLKCRCVPDNESSNCTTSAASTNVPGQHGKLPTVTKDRTAPPASSLPRPEFDSNSSNSQEPTVDYETVEAWILSQTDITELDAPEKKETKTAKIKSIWDNEVKFPRVFTPLISRSSTSVEVFFRNFGVGAPATSPLATPRVANNYGQLIPAMPTFVQRLPTAVPVQSVTVTTKSPYEVKYSYF